MNIALPALRIALITAFGLGAAISFALAAREFYTVEYERAAAEGDFSIAQTCSGWCSPRLELAQARGVTLRVAAQRTAIDNVALVSALAQRPHWSKAIIERAFWLATRAPESVAARDALADSYRATPFLRDAALWRVGQAIAMWRDLPPTMRQQVVDEAMWYAAIDGPSRQTMAERVAATPVEVAMMLRDATR